MITPWGEILIEDAHVHYFSKPFFAALAAQKPGVDIQAALGWDAPEDLASSGMSSTKGTTNTIRSTAISV